MPSPVEIFLSLQSEISGLAITQPTIESLIASLQQNTVLPLTEVGAHDILVRYTPDQFEPNGVSLDVARVVDVTPTSLKCVWQADVPRTAEYDLETGIAVDGLHNGWVNRAMFLVAPDTT